MLADDGPATMLITPTSSSDSETPVWQSPPSGTDYTVKGKTAVQDIRILPTPEGSLEKTPKTYDTLGSGIYQVGDASRLRHSRSSPGLSHRLSHKLSTVFVHPTVVHRPHLRSRPSVQSIREGGMINGSSNPSSIAGNSKSSTAMSDSPTTAKTSWGSNLQRTTPPAAHISSQSKKSAIRIQSDEIKNELPRLLRSMSLSHIYEEASTKPLAPILETAPDAILASIATVEVAANAKIYFETHFNDVFSTPPRSRRRRKLEARIRAAPMTADDRNRERLAWFREESERLRNCRIMRTKGIDDPAGESVFVSGYEVVRVLGKGSFGVVRLVKEAEEPDRKNLETSTPTSCDTKTNEKTSLKVIDEVRGTSAASGLNSQPADPVDTSNSVRYRRPAQVLGSQERQVFAMKVIRKAEMLRTGQEGHLRAERDFLVASEGCRWIIPLVASFQDSNNLYLVMEYMLGGDFLALLIRKQTLSEDVTRWYIAEMVLCVEEAHKLQWIHRDIKPDNFLISGSGHLKISDFGLAFDGHWSHDQSYYTEHRNRLIDELDLEVAGDQIDQEESKALAAAKKLAAVMSGRNNTSPTPKAKLCKEEEKPTEYVLDKLNRTRRRKLARSVVGTSQYMAPEVIRGDHYDGRCDWWSIGIILFEVSKRAENCDNLIDRQCSSNDPYTIRLQEASG